MNRPDGNQIIVNDRPHIVQIQRDKGLGISRCSDELHFQPIMFVHREKWLDL